MIRLYNWILRNLFGLQHPDKKEYEKMVLDNITQRVQEQEENVLSSIVFYIDDSNNINIKYNWANDKKSTARHMAQMLFFINTGQLEDGCVRVLQRFSETSSENLEFVKTVFDNWKGIKEKEDIILQPSDVFKFGSVHGASREEI